MAQQAEMAQVVQSYEELQSLTRKKLQELVKQFKAEDTDCLADVNGKSKNEELVEALAEHMGFTPAPQAEETPQEDPTAGLATFGDDAYLNPALTESDVMEFGEDVPSLPPQADPDPFEPQHTTDEDVDKLFEEEPEQDIPDPIIDQIMTEEGVTKEEAQDINADNLADMAEQDKNWAEQVANQTATDPDTPQESTGDSDVDALLADLGLDGINVPDLGGISFDTPPQDTPPDTPPIDTPPTPQADEPQAEKPKKKRSTLSFEDRKRIPIRQYRDYTLGMFGDILQQLDEPDNNGYKYDVLKLERFNSKAHEIFRKTKGHMHLVYTNVGSTYMIVYKQADGTFEPVLEVTNKGRGHLQSKQLANVMQVAYNEKNDQETISAEEYQKLVEQIELLPINAESAGL